MATQKLYAGAKLREVRTRFDLTQKAFATKLGVSLPYLNQMENNHRPVSTTVVLALAQEFGFDVTELSSGDAERMVIDMREALADPVFADASPPLADLRLAASNAPALTRAFLTLHQAYRQTHERLASLDEALGREDSAVRPSPWEEVRDFFHYCDNYIDAVDRAAEHLALADPKPRNSLESAMLYLSNRGISVEFREAEALRSFDASAATLTLSAHATASTQRFQLLHQIALITQADLLDATLDLARFQTDEARAIARIGLANYFAGAALMPYRDFLQAARDTRHDLERLADLSGPPSNRSLTGSARCNAPVPRGCRSFSYGSIRPVRSPNATLPHACNSRALAAPVRFGTCTARLKHRAAFCGNWPRPPMATATCVWPETCRNRAAVSRPRFAATLSGWGARYAMPTSWSMPTTSTSRAIQCLSRSGYPAGSASGQSVTSDPSRRWNARCPSTMTAGACCPTASDSAVTPLRVQLCCAGKRGAT